MATTRKAVTKTAAGKAQKRVPATAGVRPSTPASKVSGAAFQLLIVSDTAAEGVHRHLAAIRTAGTAGSLLPRMDLVNGVVIGPPKPPRRNWTAIGEATLPDGSRIRLAYQAAD